MNFRSKESEYHQDPTEEEIEASGHVATLEKIRDEIRIAVSAINDQILWEDIKREYDRLDNAATKWAELVYTDKHYCCRASYGKYFPGLYSNFENNKQSIEYQWIAIKNVQEAAKFWAGDFSAQMGGKYGRYFDIAEGHCCLCKRKTLCFWFDDNESYGKEELCVKCIKVIYEKLFRA